MNRRGLLATTGTALLAGCFDDTQPADDPDDEHADTTDDRNDQQGTSTYEVSLASVDIEDLEGVAPAIHVEDVAPGVREIVAATIDGGTTVDAIDDALALFFTDYEYVLDGDGYYELAATLPTYTVGLDAVDASDVPDNRDRVTRYLDLENHRGRGIVVEAIDAGATETTYVPPELRSAIHETEYLLYNPPSASNETYYRWSLSVDDPGAPYALEANPVSADAVFGERGVAYQSLPERAREEFSPGRTFRTDESDAPAIADVALDEDTDIVLYEGEYYRIEIAAN